MTEEITRPPSLPPHFFRSLPIPPTYHKGIAPFGHVSLSRAECYHHNPGDANVTLRDAQQPRKKGWKVRSESGMEGKKTTIEKNVKLGNG